MRLLLALLLALVPAASVADAPLPVAQAQVLERLPHDATAFTQGFFVEGGAFYESTGHVGRSFIRKVDPKTGRVLRQAAVPAPYFGEGIAQVGGEILSLTWQHGTGFRWRAADFRKVGAFRYQGEGWGLASDGPLLVMSDGSATLRVLDPKTLAVKRTIAVTLRGAPLRDLNEIEIVDGEILANVWHANAIVRIDPASGRVTGLIDLSALVREIAAADAEAVPNGIAWDRKARRLYVTGKLWPRVFRIAWPPAA
ncbi:glutaminyl-peptide cyclotransferase [Sphingomonas sp.]|uniref:glutaminyl-peptide cyclotransferase n=1 Tax=Sphingomonas sp. TaxID=28214 RepID=UPI0035C7C093